MDKTVSYVNYQSPAQLNQTLKIFSKSILFLKKKFSYKREQNKISKNTLLHLKDFFSNQKFHT